MADVQTSSTASSQYHDWAAPSDPVNNNWFGGSWHGVIPPNGTPANWVAPPTLNYKLTVDTTELDKALEKANNLFEVLRQVDKLYLKPHRCLCQTKYAGTRGNNFSI